MTVGGVRKWLRLNEITWVGPWSHRISVPIRGNTRELKTSVTMNLSLSLYHVRTQWELTIWKSGWRLVSQTEPHLRLNLRLPISRVMRNTFLLFKPPSLWYWYFLMEAEQTQNLTLSEELRSQAFWFRPWHNPLCSAQIHYRTESEKRRRKCLGSVTR